MAARSVPGLTTEKRLRTRTLFGCTPVRNVRQDDLALVEVVKNLFHGVLL